MPGPPGSRLNLPSPCGEERSCREQALPVPSQQWEMEEARLGAGGAFGEQSRCDRWWEPVVSQGSPGEHRNTFQSGVCCCRAAGERRGHTAPLEGKRDRYRL